MPLTKVQKEEVISEVKELIENSKMTVIAKYQGLDVKAMQELRREAKSNDTKVKVIKNRLVAQVLGSSDKYKEIDPAILEGMNLFAFNAADEVAAAQVLNKFAKTNQSLEFVGAINSEGKFIEASEVKSLAELPSKDQLLANLINTLNSPINKISSLSASLTSILSGLEAKASN